MLVDKTWVWVPRGIIECRMLEGDSGETNGGHWCGERYEGGFVTYCAFYPRRLLPRPNRAVAAPVASTWLANRSSESRTTNPFGTSKSTTIDFSFGSQDGYKLYDPESTVDFLNSTNWNPSLGPQGSVRLLNGDVISIPKGWTGEQAATFVALTAWASVANGQPELHH